MIAKNNIYMKAATEEMYIRSADEMIEQRCRARNDYYRTIRTYDKTIQDLEESNATLLSENQTLLSEKEALLKRIAELESQTQP